MEIDFKALVHEISRVHGHFHTQAVKAINISLTLRNWLIGRYIREYELKGSDRAVYGARLFSALESKLTARNVSNCDRRQLYRYRDFYRAYPRIGGKNPKVGTLSPQFSFSSEDLLNRLSYSHFEELTELQEPFQRAFYEAECLRGHWSVRELKRQIATLYYERSVLSRNKKRRSELVHDKTESEMPAHVIRDPYVFEFLGLKVRESASESVLEDSLLDKLQEFLLELGRGFCFEARQKRIVIGGERLLVDLVFYHRLLKCHILLELKIDGFRHEYLGQLNTYVNWFRRHEMSPGDNPPIGILLCTKKNHALVEYATAGMANRLFVSKYQLKLPKKEEIRRFLEEQLE